ncbi:exo-polygalacturonase [Cordyceps militaris]|uniref:Exo-polygalacturonase n=1 Tax=Cordyceps militaris TaxID=73501 RepID=A0A2H4SR11_CORMI|nr:exo-polygalacturonase [Cordyceps militaris]
MRLLAVLVAVIILVAASGDDVRGQIPSIGSGGDDVRVQIPSIARNITHWREMGKASKRKVCYIRPGHNNADGDDGPLITQTLNINCRRNSIVVFPGPVYNIRSPMTVGSLRNVTIHLYGRFLWSTNIDYWLSQSMPVGLQNQTTVFHFGGDNVTLHGHGVGTLDGNGQVWYDWAGGEGNLPRRPMMVNWRRLTNSTVRGVRFVQSPMWTMAVTYSQNVEFADIYVNNTSTNGASTLNTDGIDTYYSRNITLRRWHIKSGDDAVALKGNSTGIRVLDSVVYGGQGLAIGSVGQYRNVFEYITHFYARNVTLFDTTYGLYLKTWGGNPKGLPPNGGGGGLGLMSDIVLEDIKLRGVRKAPLFAWQCENYEGGLGKDCQSSQYRMRDFVASWITGWAATGVEHAGWFQCSERAGGCHRFTVSDVHVTRGQCGDELTSWHCENMHDHTGFNCTD